MKTQPLKNQQQTTALAHRRRLAHYCHLELSTGGPDPQVDIVAAAARERTDDWRERAWMAGCFVNPYTVGAGAVLWNSLPQLCVDKETIKSFCEKYGLRSAALPMRRERRAVYSTEKFATSLSSYAKWVRDELPHMRQATYPELWASIADNVIYVGRYAAMKLLETLFRAGVTTEKHAQQYDIRPNGAWSPRLTLAMVRPESAEYLDRGNGIRNLMRVDDIARDVKQDIERLIGRDMTFFEFETLLCNYRQGLKGKYPGRSHDRELAHYRRTESYWGADHMRTRGLDFYKLRRDLFPSCCLGETDERWEAARPALEQSVEHGYFWCDTVHRWQPDDKPVDIMLPSVYPARMTRQMTVHEVIPGLFMSDNLKGKDTERKRRMLLSRQIDKVYCLLRTIDEDTGYLAQIGLIDYVQRPLSDGRTLDEESFIRVRNEVVDDLRNKRRVLVHCIAGKNRSGLLSAMTVMKLNCCSGKRAMDTVRAARPIALINPAFSEYLEKTPSEVGA